MKKFIGLLLITFLFSSVAYAKAISINYNNREYNLVIYDKVDFAKPVNFLKEKFKKYHFFGEIKDCSQVIDIPAGTAQGNHSFGAVCSLENDKGIASVMICADEMVGHTNILLTEWATPKRLQEFVIQNCVSG